MWVTPDVSSLLQDKTRDDPKVNCNTSIISDKGA